MAFSVAAAIHEAAVRVKVEELMVGMKADGRMPADVRILRMQRKIIGGWEITGAWLIHLSDGHIAEFSSSGVLTP